MAAAARPELREREDPAERLEPADKPCGSHIRCVDKSASLSIFMHLYVKCACARMPTTPNIVPTCRAAAAASFPQPDSRAGCGTPVHGSCRRPYGDFSAR